MLLAGEIGKPHGTAGEVYVIRISDDPHRFDPGATLLHEDGRELVVRSSHSHRDRFLVHFEGAVDRESAQGLRGALYVDPSSVRDLDGSEFWESDLVGCGVLLTDGTEVGEVSDVIVRPAQDLLQIETPRGQRLVPFVGEIVTEVNAETRRITIDPPEGLLD
jgi:16S rRNA processing protein RimM